jgi:cardiolipin synthase
MIEWVAEHLVLAGTGLVAIAAGIAVVHVLLYKDEVRAAIAWVGLIVLVPLLGSVLYYLIGINRIRRRAVDLRRATVSRDTTHALPWLTPEKVAAGVENPEASELAHIVRSVTGRPLLSGNRVEPLLGGDEAYPAMLQAIDSAQTSVCLTTYLFDNDATGERFVQALSAAERRGVQVRVLIDAVGARYSRPPIDKPLRRARVPVARFLPTIATRLPWFNLRNHRKILVVDGRMGFTGGMNIRDHFAASERVPQPDRDLHFRIEGPVVAHLRDVFAEDWEFATGESLEGDAWFPKIEVRGETVARGIPDGPDEDFDALNFTLLGAIAAATRRVRIVTPYFLPDQPLVYALNTAALSGLEVDIVVPEHGNVPLVAWAMRAHFPLVLGVGCRVWLSPKRPFDHAKLMVVDDYWVLLGSSNWDPRSLRLNFEFNVETYDRELAGRMHQLIDERIRLARPLTSDELASRALPLRLRDSAARLLTPYL